MVKYYYDGVPVPSVPLVSRLTRRQVRAMYDVCDTRTVLGILESHIASDDCLRAYLADDSDEWATLIAVNELQSRGWHAPVERDDDDVWSHDVWVHPDYGRGYTLQDACRSEIGRGP